MEIHLGPYSSPCGLHLFIEPPLNPSPNPHSRGEAAARPWASVEVAACGRGEQARRGAAGHAGRGLATRRTHGWGKQAARAGSTDEAGRVGGAARRGAASRPDARAVAAQGPSQRRGTEGSQGQWIRCPEAWIWCLGTNFLFRTVYWINLG